MLLEIILAEKHSNLGENALLKTSLCYEACELKGFTKEGCKIMNKGMLSSANHVVIKDSLV